MLSPRFQHQLEHLPPKLRLRACLPLLPTIPSSHQAASSLLPRQQGFEESADGILGGSGLRRNVYLF